MPSFKFNEFDKREFMDVLKGIQAALGNIDGTLSRIIVKMEKKKVGKKTKKSTKSK